MEINTAQTHLTENSFVSTQATVLHHRLAIITSGFLILVVLLVFPYAHQMLPHIPSFIALYSALALFADLITAILFFGQFFRTGSLSLLGLAATYLYSSLIIFIYVLSFPGVFSEAGLLHAGTQTTNWLWVFWHTGFPLGILFSLLLEKRYSGRPASFRQIRRQCLLVLFLIPLLILLLSFLAIQSDRFFPIMIVNGDYSRLITSGVGPTILVIGGCAWIMSIFQARRGTVMHTWLSVAALATVLDVALNLWSGSRYSLGWYLARATSVVAATFVLCALLYQVSNLYERIVDQVQELTSLKERNRVRNQFFNTMSHELRTPLTSIIGFSELLLDDAMKSGWDEQQKGNLERILMNSEHLLDLINDVLDLSKIEAGRMALNYSQVAVGELLDNLLQEAQSIAIKRNLFLRTEIEEGIGSLETNPAKLHQVLQNLISNALKFTEHGGVTLAAHRVLSSDRETQRIAFIIQDSGIGIPADIQEHIFEAFYQADMSYTRKVGGTGLGLAIVRQLTELLGGTVSVESVLGKGSTFTVTFPIKAAGLIDASCAGYFLSSVEMVQPGSGVVES